jgi:hypothetical protein
MLEAESPFDDLPQMQNPDGGGQGPPVSQAEEVALPQVRGHPDAKAEEVLSRRGLGPSLRVNVTRAPFRDRAGQNCQNRSFEWFASGLRFSPQAGKAAILILFALFAFVVASPQCRISNSGNGH